MQTKTNSLCLLLIAVILWSVAFPALAQTPGTSSDPLVTKSYLDFAAKFRNVDVKANEIINCESGAFILLLNGQLRLELQKGGYVIDVSNGRRVSSNTNIQLYHLIAIPDGTLVSFRATKDVKLMAMGLKDEAE